MAAFAEYLFAVFAFVIWWFVVSLAFRMSLGHQRLPRVVIGAMAFLLISIWFHVDNVPPIEVSNFVESLFGNLGASIDAAISWIGSVFGVNWATNLAVTFKNAWANFDDMISNPLSVGAGVGGLAFFANLVLVAAYVVVRLFLVGAIQLVAVFWRMATASDEQEDEEDPAASKDSFEAEGIIWWFDTRSVKTATLYFYRISVGILGVCLATYAWDHITSIPLSFRGQGIRDDILHIYWAGLIIFTGELTNAVRQKGRFDRFVERFQKAAETEEDDSLAQLFADYKTSHGHSDWLFSKEFVPDPDLPEYNAQEAHGRQAAAAGLGAFSVGKKLYRLKEGTLTDSDFDFLAKLVKVTKDYGGTVLILCPQSQHDDQRPVEDELYYPDDVGRQLISNISGSMGGTVFAVTQNVRFMGDGTAATDIEYNVIVGSEFELADAISGPQDSVYEALRRIRCIIFVEFQRLDSGVISLQIQRLRRLTDEREVSVYCQSDGRQGLLETLRNLFQVNDVDAFNPYSSTGPAQTRRFWLLWRHSSGLMARVTKFAGLTKEQNPLSETLPLLLLNTFAQRFQAAIYDPSGRIRLSDWRHRWFSVLQGRAKRNYRKLAGMVQRAQPFSLFRGKAVGQVVFQEDFSNIFDAIQRYKNFEHSGDTMIHIVSSWYPMRDFLFHKLQSENREKSYDLTANEDLKPIQPRPRHGVKQVAIELYDALSRGGVAERRIHNILYRETSDLTPSLLKKLGATSSQRGLEFLFLRVLGLDLKVKRDLDPDDRKSSIALDHAEPPKNFYLARVNWEAEGDHRRPIANIYTGDYGLTYAKNTYLSFGRGTFQVKSVKSIEEPFQVETEILVRDEDPRAEGYYARPLVKFCRNYIILNEHQRFVGTDYAEDVKKYPAILIEKGDQRRPSPGQTARRLVHLSFQRETFGRYGHEHNVPFGEAQHIDYSAMGGNDDWQGTPTGVKISRIHQPCLVLSTVNLSNQKDTKAPEIRKKVAFTLAATLNDMIASLFPKEAHRIAVISPQAKPKFPKMRRADVSSGIRHDEDLDAYVDLTYPHFSEPDEEPDEQIGIPLDWSQKYGDLFGDGFIGEQTSIDPDQIQANSKSDRIDLLVFEDASLDLGVVRAMEHTWPTIERIWIEYLAWLAEIPNAENPYAFGTAGVASQFEFEAALDWMRA
ncbi:hypothetical protein AIOL_001860 [Candidatus Rhodobacter oscarellae]|uniref:Uncharacterized protein n=2 Tax=Candidatus Rhodobacter oscarellae TaxID=1675527 RepID=A0A0J9GTQ6_9RHOB|nr:hypothetical protein AIOL_001860 [Candidatus Rhodobacter lobularis]